MFRCVAVKSRVTFRAPRKTDNVVSRSLVGHIYCSSTNKDVFTKTSTGKDAFYSYLFNSELQMSPLFLFYRFVFMICLTLNYETKYLKVS